MTAKLILYGKTMSPPVRAVLLTLKALDLDFDFKILDHNDNMSPEYLKKNPQHTMPTLEDNGKCIVDSHAICAYLVRKYGKDDSLYPKDFYQRAVVDQRLHYENGVLFMTIIKQTIGGLFLGQLKKDEIPEKLKPVSEAYDMLEIFMGDHSYIAGQSVTIADFSILSSVTSLLGLVPVQARKHPKLAAWLARMQKLPYYEEANGEGVKALNDLILPKLA